MSTDTKQLQLNKSLPWTLKNIWGASLEGRVDYIFLILVLLLLTIGLVSLFSASFAHALYEFGDSYRFISRQVAFGLLGVGALFVFSRIDYRFYNTGAVIWALYSITVILLIAVFFFDPINDAQRWIHLGPTGNKITFQPSEIAKFLSVIMLSHLIHLNHDRMNTSRFGIMPPVVALIPLLLLIVQEPHLSATLIIVAIAATLLYIGGVRFYWFILLGLVVGGAVALLAVSDNITYVMPRIQIWKDPWSDPLNLGYQTIQSLYAIGSGGAMGEGIGGSAQKYLYLPELQNDYIFAIVAEELGFVGTTLIIILFALLVWRGFLIGIRCKDRFGTLTAIGLTAQVGYQAILNILVVTNTIPVTGVSLPFFSAGGTSLTLLLAQMGVVLSISRNMRTKEAEYSEEDFFIKEEPH